MFRKNLLLPIVERIENRDILSKVSQLENHYQRSFGDRKKKQQELVFKTLSWAQEQVPYYQDLFQSIGFQAENVLKDIKYLQDIPVLTKDIIIENRNRLFAKPLTDGKRIPCRTGGSTGKKVVIDYNEEAADWSSAVTLFARNLVGKDPGLKELHFASDFGDKPPFKAKLREAAKNISLNRRNVFYRDFEEGSVKEMLTMIEEFKPYIVHCHPSTMYAIADCVDKPYKVSPFQIYESSGELLDPRKRAKIQEVFNCRVVDRYGLAEFGIVAYEADEHAGLRVFDDIVFPEVVDGEITLTGLRNPLMPLIRYKTGDMAELLESESGFYFQNMLGRIHDKVEIDGKTYLTHYIQDVLDHRVKGVKEFQIKKLEEEYELRLVADTNANRDEIISKVKSFFPTKMNVKFINHDDLELVGWRGKFRYVI